jgi:hypothetical protein
MSESADGPLTAVLVSKLRLGASGPEGIVPTVIAAAGVDTWSVCWYLRDGSSGVRAMESMATVKAARSDLIEDSIEGHRVGWFPGQRMVFAEGHPVQGSLAGAAELPGALARITTALADRGILVPDRRYAPKEVFTKEEGWVNLPVIGGTGRGGIRRLDSTVDLSFDDPLRGLAALAGVAALPLPRMKTQIMREAGGRRVETVYLRGYSGKNVLGRWYDKGVESGAAARGCWVRPEDQRRYRANTRPSVEAVAGTSYVRDQFVRRFEPLWRAAKGVKVGGVLDIGKRLEELIAEGTITARQAKSMAGAMVLEAAGCEYQSRATRMRDRARMRDHGLVLADGVLDEVEVDLGEVLEEAMDSSAWGAQG